MKLIENMLNIPLDILRFIDKYVKYEQINNKNIKEAVKFWIENKEEGISHIGVLQ